MRVRSGFVGCLTALLLLAGGEAWAQPTLRIEQRGDERALARTFDGLDAARIPTGLLRDRVLPLADLDALDGEEGAGPVPSALWRQAYHELAASRVPGGQADALPSLGALLDRARPVLAEGAVPLALFDVGYARLRDDALAQGLVEVGPVGLRDAPEADASPYETRRATALAALGPPAAALTVRFVLPRALYVSHAAPRADAFEVDFDDGAGPRRLVPGVPVTVTYARPGRKTIRLIASDGRAVRSVAAPFDVDPVPEPDLSWTDQTATRPFAGEAAAYDARIFFGDGPPALTDPVVFVEGFDAYYNDPERRRTWQDMYRIAEREGFADSLLARGYDLVLLKLHHAADYVQRNAFALEHLLARLRTELPAGRQTVVVGPSMGGLIARYALAFMEAQGLPHGVRLFASLDAPHDGANIPLGDQFLMEFFDNDSDLALLGKQALATPAARQQLLYHYGAFPEDDSLRTAFAAEIDALGFPAEPALVAAADGSGYGLAQQGNERVGGRRMVPGDKIVEWRYRSLIVDLDGDVWAVPDQGPETQIFEGLKNVIGPHYRALDVFVDGTLPLDNAPGGSRATQGEIAAGDAPYGRIYTAFPDHAWIPTTSALALAADHPFYDLQQDPDSLLTLHPDGRLATAVFDAVYFPEDNQVHARATPENTPWLLEQIGPVPPAEWTVALRLVLAGAYHGAAMRTSLRADGHLPAAQPFADPHFDGTPLDFDEVVSIADFTDAHDEVVDWLLVELRAGPEAADHVARRAALLRSDGAVVDLDGLSPLRFSGLAPAPYHVVVRPRNHLPVMSRAPVDVAAGHAAYDFSTAAAQAYGAEATVDLSGTGDGPWACPPGDADADGQVIAVDYQSFWRVQNGGPDGYHAADFDLDGQVIATDYQSFWRPFNSRESRVPEAAPAVARAP